MVFEGFQEGFYSTRGKCLEGLHLKTKNIRKGSGKYIFGWQYGASGKVI